MNKHRGHTAKGYLLFSVRKENACAQFSQYIAEDEIRTEIHRVATHNMLTLDGCQHTVEPAQVAVALILHGGSTYTAQGDKLPGLTLGFALLSATRE